MSYRSEDSTNLVVRLADVERRLRAIEGNGATPPDPNWVLTEVSGELKYLYLPSGATGITIGVK